MLKTRVYVLTEHVVCPGGWSVAYGSNTHGQYVQVDLLRNYVIESIATQGRADSIQYVTRYTLSYTADGQNSYTDVIDTSGSTVYFDGNRYMYSRHVHARKKFDFCGY